MSIEKLAAFGIMAFIFIVVLQGLRTVRETKKLNKRRLSKRKRRKSSSEPVALDIARSLLDDVAHKYPELVKDAQSTGVIPKKLSKEIDLTLEHYLGRVNSKFRGLFHQQTSEIILGKNTKFI